jgi:hypothetical protein
MPPRKLRVVSGSIRSRLVATDPEVCSFTLASLRRRNLGAEHPTMADPSDLVITLASSFAAATIVVQTLGDPNERPQVRGAKPRAKWKLLV